MTEDVNRRIAIGAGWMVLLRWTDRAIGLVSIAILARLLTPEDFGLMGYAMLFMAILELFFLFGLETALIRDQEATRESYNTAWTLQILKGLVLSVLLVASARAVATFFEEPSIVAILYWVAVIPVLRGVENIGVVDFQKNLTLDKEFYFRFSVRVVGTVITITVAYALRNYWALVIGQITQAGLRVLGSYLMSPFRPRLSLSQFSKIFGFSKWLLVQNIFSGLNERLPVIVLGRFFSATSVAYFNVGFEVANLASQEVAGPIRRALFPGMAIIQKERDRMIATLKSTLGIIVLVALPATVGIGITAALLVPLLLGEQWIDLIPVLQVLCLHALTFVYYPSSHVVYYSVGIPHVSAYISILRFVILLPISLLLVPEHGAIGAAWALFITNWSLIALDYYVLIRVLRTTLWNLLEAVWRSTLATFLMAVCALEVATWDVVVRAFSNVGQLVIIVAVGVVSYTTSLMLIWAAVGRPRGAEAYILGVIKGLIARAISLPRRSGS